MFATPVAQDPRQQPAGVFPFAGGAGTLVFLGLFATNVAIGLHSSCQLSVATPYHAIAATQGAHTPLYVAVAWKLLHTNQLAQHSMQAAMYLFTP